MKGIITPIILKWRSKAILRKLQVDSGLFVASAASQTGYNKAWLRDNIYEAIGMEAARDMKSVKRAYNALFNLLLKHEYKIDWAIKEKPNAAYKYIHARYHPFTFDEFHEPWSNKQNDSVGAFLFKVGELFGKGVKVFRNREDLRILQKLVYYLGSIQYWHDPDNGVWEKEEEIHASSIGACLAGLKAVKKIVDVPEELIKKGEHALNSILPRESHSKETDLAQLSLIYPYNVVSPEQRETILGNVEKNLVREKGVIRHSADWYYNGGGKEAQWVMGFAWLARIYRDLKNSKKYELYMKKLIECANWKGEFPELYFYSNNELVANENTPLGWSQAMYLVAAEA